MFQRIVDVLNSEKLEAPTFLYYLKRHIEVDSGEHGPLAERCLHYLIGDNQNHQELAQKAGANALEIRRELWDNVLKSL